MFELKTERVPWTTQQTFAGVLFTLVPWLALSFVLSLLNTRSSSTGHLSPQLDSLNAVITFIFSAVVEGAFLFAPLYFVRRATRHTTDQPVDEVPARSIPQLLGFRGFDVTRVIPLIVLLLVMIFLVNGAYQYVITAFHLNIQTNDQTVLQEGRTAPITTYATLLVAVFVAPFCEEVFFRSFVLLGLLRDMSLGVAIVLSALIFAVAHGDPGSFAVLFFIGLALAFLRWRTKSIWPGMILHMLNNGISGLLILIALQH